MIAHFLSLRQVFRQANWNPLTSKMCAKKAKIFNTEKTEQTEIKKLKRIFQSLPSLFAQFSLVNLFGCGLCAL